MFHLVSAFEAFIAANWSQATTINRSGIHFQGLDAFQVLEVDSNFILVRLAMLSNLTEEKIDHLGIDSLFNVFGWDDWIVFHESQEDLDDIIYCSSEAKAYSVEACVEQPEDDDQEESDLRAAELEHAMSEAYEKGWAE